MLPRRAFLGGLLMTPAIIRGGGLMRVRPVRHIVSKVVPMAVIAAQSNLQFVCLDVFVPGLPTYANH